MHLKSGVKATLLLAARAPAPGCAEMALVAWAGCLARGLAALAHGRQAGRLSTGEA